MTKRVLAWGLAAIVLVTAAAGCGGSRAARTPVIVDTDLSTDDAVALLFLAVDPRVDLRAVAVSGTGLVHCPVGARNALELLALAGRTDVPVACGRTEPLAGVNAVPDGWRQAADTLFGLTLPPAKSRPGASAVALIDKAIDGAPRPPTIVELAPMTNLGSAFRARPALAKKVRRVVAMAGAVAVPGNAPGDPATETNAWIDPRAAQIVAGSGAALTLVPLDATNDVPVTTFFARALKRYHYATPEATFVWDLVQATGMDRGDSYFWDPLAASVAVDPTLVRTSARHLDVNATSGRTTASPGGTTAVATSADRSRFERQLLSTLLRGAPFTIPPDRPDATLTLSSSRCTYSGATTLNAGPIVIDTINRTATPFGWAIGHLDGTHSLTDLRRYAARLQGRTITAPKWFTGDANGSPVPPHTRLTWQAAVALSTTGSAIFVCATMAPTHIWLPAVVPVYGSH